MSQPERLLSEASVAGKEDERTLRLRAHPSASAREQAESKEGGGREGEGGKGAGAELDMG